MKPTLILGAFISLFAYIAICFYTNWQTALAVYVLVFITSLDKDIFK